MAYCGDSQNHWGPCHKVGQIWDHQGYLILIIALDSIYLNLYENVAHRSGKHIPRPMQVTCPPPRSERGPTFSEWFLMNPSIMVFICMPLSRRAIQLSPLTLTLATFSIPYLLCLGHTILGHLGMVTFPWRAQAPFFGTIPSFWFQYESVLNAFTNGKCLIKCTGLLQC